MKKILIAIDTGDARNIRQTNVPKMPLGPVHILTSGPKAQASTAKAR